MMILLYIIVWFVCGTLACLFAGYIDRKVDIENCAPVTFLFFLGPIGILLCLITYLTTIPPNFIQKIYDFSNKK